MKTIKNLSKKTLTFILLFVNAMIYAQGNGKAGIDAATNEIKGYFENVSNLILAIAAVVGLVGAIRVYIQWQGGEQDINKKIMGWFGSVLFIALVGVVLKVFFGL